MEMLIRARPLIIAVFFLAIFAIGIGAYSNVPSLFQSAALLAHVALMLFVVTESFGSVSLKRSKASRIMARTFLGLYVLMFASMISQLLVLPFSS